MKRKIYVETSVISYLTARPSKTIIGAAHQQITLAWGEKGSDTIFVLCLMPDALHIAIATVNGVDYLLTWNCRHIANPEIQRGIAEYLEQIGLFLPFICTPE